MSAAVSWSGGKESCLALHKVLQRGVKVSHLLTFVSNGRCISHGLRSELILAQSKAVDIPLIQKEVTWDTYGEGFREALDELKKAGVDKLVLGDILEIPAHEGWVDNVCKEMNVQPIKPLWHLDPLKILNEFVARGFKAIVVKARANLLNEKWIGREVDQAFITEIGQLKNINPCGELGEYHTFVYDGPLFKKPIKIKGFEKRLIDNYWFLDISLFLFDK
ncbi:MAG: diphthine--ammonia ligase [Candidatus Bathyarchaeota archaeon]|nr:diphthine--ammonia ligase [Candidatus Bathyarchaeota archaeon]MDW8040614.1 diphthine--ammonia ligase [Nitrososphaerota archaeon]